MKADVEEDAIAAKEQQDTGSSPVNFFDCLLFPESDDKEEAQET